MTKPIKPHEVVAAKITTIPNGVIEAFNELIVKNWNGRSATIRQDDIVCLIKYKIAHVSSQDIYTKHWLDVEQLFESAGWKVEYDKPGYNESYPATFKFSKK